MLAAAKLQTGRARAPRCHRESLSGRTREALRPSESKRLRWPGSHPGHRGLLQHWRRTPRRPLRSARVCSGVRSRERSRGGLRHARPHETGGDGRTARRTPFKGLLSRGASGRRAPATINDQRSTIRLQRLQRLQRLTGGIRWANLGAVTRRLSLRLGCDRSTAVFKAHCVTLGKASRSGRVSHARGRPRGRGAVQPAALALRAAQLGARLVRAAELGVRETAALGKARNKHGRAVRGSSCRRRRVAAGGGGAGGEDGEGGEVRRRPCGEAECFRQASKTHHECDSAALLSGVHGRRVPCCPGNSGGESVGAPGNSGGVCRRCDGPRARG